MQIIKDSKRKKSDLLQNDGKKLCLEKSKSSNIKKQMVTIKLIRSYLPFLILMIHELTANFFLGKHT
jgi:hypothetical protein